MYFLLLVRLLPYYMDGLDRIRCSGEGYYRPELLEEFENGVLVDCGA